MNPQYVNIGANDDKVIEECAEVIQAIIQNIDVRLIEELDWGMLAIQNLGKGQLQIKNMNNKLSFVPVDRESWMAELKENAIIYYDKLINKINNYKKTWS